MNLRNIKVDPLLVVSVLVGLPMVLPTTDFYARFLLSSVTNESNIIGIPSVSLIFAAVCVPVYACLYGLYKQNRLAVAVSAVLFPLLWLMGLPTAWSKNLTGATYAAEVAVTVAAALVLCAWYVMRFRQLGRKPARK